MKNLKKSKNGSAMWIAYATMWVAVAVAVIAGMIITKSAWCLWAFLLPSSMKIETSSTSESNDEDGDSKQVEDDLK